ncbi:hypothetical protein DB29_02656 [Shouchella clausii]|nr:hypothetical protein DB29_02656 [Shouchella clausii]
MSAWIEIRVALVYNLPPHVALLVSAWIEILPHTTTLVKLGIGYCPVP